MLNNSDTPVAVDEHPPGKGEIKKAALKKAERYSADAFDFVPGLLAIQESPPARLPRTVMYMVSVLFLILLLWAIFGKLDIVTSAEGRLVPQTFVKIVQPADGGIVQEILVRDGEHVLAGQVLIRMDARDAHADESTLQTQLAMHGMQLRRIDAELAGTELRAAAGDAADLLGQTQAQLRDRRDNYEETLAAAKQGLTKAQRDLDSGREVLAKLKEVLPILKQQSDAYADMGKDGYVPQIQMRDKEREYLEKSRDLKAQESTVAGLAASVGAAEKQVAQATAKYRSDLQNERAEIEGQYRKLQQDWLKQEHKTGLLELKAPQSGIAKDLATHTIGTVVSPGTVLLSLVPDNEPLQAEVMVKNEDVGFIYNQQKVKLKLAAYPFQQYGMLEGRVITIGADVSENNVQAPSGREQGQKGGNPGAAPIYRALVDLTSQQLLVQGVPHKLVAGMQVVAEINQGQRSVMEYLLSPLKKTLDESGRER